MVIVFGAERSVMITMLDTPVTSRKELEWVSD